jgi:hypothetical protein
MRPTGSYDPRCDAFRRAALAYADAEEDRDFHAARVALAESLLRWQRQEIPDRLAIRVTIDAACDRWRRVTEAAIAFADAFAAASAADRTHAYAGSRYANVQTDLGRAYFRLRKAGEEWAASARWVPEPWRAAA